LTIHERVIAPDNRQVDEVPHTKAFAEFAQLGAAGRKETVQQLITAEFLQPLLPTLGAEIQAFEDPGQLRRDRDLALAKEATVIFDQFESGR
jgi:hypothetical protein